MNMMDNLINMFKTQNYYHRKINIGIIGAGRAGEFHVKSLLQFSHFNLKYICDCDLEKGNRLGEIYGNSCHVTNNLSELLSDSEVEAIIIASSITKQIKKFFNNWSKIFNLNHMCWKSLFRWYWKNTYLR